MKINVLTIIVLLLFCINLASALPSINFITPTELNNSTLLTNNINVNIEFSGVNLSEAFISLYNSTAGLIDTSSLNITTQTSFYRNYTGLVNGVYYFNAGVVDDSNFTVTETRMVNIRADVLYPSIVITSPSIYITTNFTTTSININYTVNDTNLESCKWSSNLGLTNTTISCGTNISYTANQGTNNIKVYATDLVGHTNSSSVNFYVDSISPSLNILYPISGNYYNRTVTGFNYTGNLTELKSCWYSLNQGSTNSTATCGANITGLTSTEGSNTWTIYAYDFLNNLGSQAISFIMDTIKPMLESIRIYTTYNSAKVYYTSNESINFTIKYGTSQTNLYMNVSEDSYDTDSYTYLDSLANGTTYYFNITICDRAFNCITNGTYNFTTNTTSNICQTTYTCSDWNACTSAGTQIRSCSKINSSCDAPAVDYKRSCTYITDDSAILYTALGSDINTTGNLTEKSFIDDMKDGVKTLSVFWKVIIAILVIGILIWIAFGIFKFFKHSAPPRQDYPEDLSSEEIDDYLDNVGTEDSEDSEYSDN